MTEIKHPLHKESDGDNYEVVEIGIDDEPGAPGESGRLRVVEKATIKDPEAQTEREGVRLPDDHTRGGR